VAEIKPRLATIFFFLDRKFYTYNKCKSTWKWQNGSIKNRHKVHTYFYYQCWCLHSP